ncbi:MAG: hypothetical protein JXX14_06825 [Deltaproteobacteria bacterium]|nr:hypothetical protein [Deltaproteobacteria bacterium]
MNLNIKWVWMRVFWLCGAAGCAMSQPVDSWDVYDDDNDVTEDEADDSGDDDDSGDGEQNIGDGEHDSGDGDHDASDEDVFCDGSEVDCYGHGCWECALENQCEDADHRCREDSGETGCDRYRSCILRDCCNGDGCLEGDEWISCCANCQMSLDTLPAAIALFQEISKCVVCDACPISCAGKRPDEFHICVNEKEINSPDASCYDEDAEAGEIACYSWAAWGGPCTPWVQKCYADPECWALQECFDDSWIFDDWSKRQEKCLGRVSESVASLFWDQRQCIYCDACEISCLPDAGSASCDEYSPLY